MVNTKKIFFYYVDNDIEDIKYFTTNFNPACKEKVVQYSTSVQTFYQLLKKDVASNNFFKIVIINNFIHSKGLNTTSLTSILPMIKSLDKNIAVIAFSENNEYNSEINISGYVKKNNDFIIVLQALILRLISEKKVKNNVLYIKFAIICLSICIFTFIVLFSFNWIYY